MPSLSPRSRVRRLACASVFLLLGLVDAVAAFAQSPEGGRKQTRALRLPDGSIRLDGCLDEDIWHTVTFITDFVRRKPDEGQLPSDPIDVRIAFDSAALYVGARLSSSGPIQAPLGRRDEAEYLMVSLDTYLDRRTAATVGITAAVVRLDRYRDPLDPFTTAANPGGGVGLDAKIGIGSFFDERRAFFLEGDELLRSSVDNYYDRLGELSAARSGALRVYGTGGTTAVALDDGSLRVDDGDASFVRRNGDFNVVSFRSNIVLRWEWRLGSTLYLVWQQDRAAQEVAATRTSIRDMFTSLASRGDNFFALKASFWFSPN